MVGIVKKSIDTISPKWFFKKVFQLWDGGRGIVRNTRETVRLEMRIPSIFNSPWIRGKRKIGSGEH